MKSYSTSLFYGTRDHQEFINGLQHCVNQVAHVGGIFTGDNLFTYGRNLGFLDDEVFMAAFERNAKNLTERSLMWRYHTLCWAARHASKLDGDFMECACYKGTSARLIAEVLNFGALDKKYYLYDLFEHDETMDHHSLPEHGKDLFEHVRSRFTDLQNVVVTKGSVPEILHEIAPEKIAFLHLDLNSAAAERGALEVIFDRIVPGGMIVLDDYGWLAYRDQKVAEDAFFEARNYHVLELPTGQGLLIK